MPVDGRAYVAMSIAGPHGPLGIRLYPAAEPDQQAGLVWLHGGAFIGGDLDMAESDWVASQFATAGVAVVTVDYRLASVPEWMIPHVARTSNDSHFPVASEEVAAAFLWAAGHEGLANVVCWAIGGASAGANLAASAALRLRDAAGIAPRALLLAYPLVHSELPTMSAELQSKYDELPIQERFSPETVTALNLNYVVEPAELDNPYAFPGGHSMVGLPPTLILNSDIDSLRASGEKFASELALDGVDVTVIREPGTTHGHLDKPESDGAQRSIRRMIHWFGEVRHE